MTQSNENEAIRRDIESLKNDLADLAKSYRADAERRAQAGADSAREKYGELRDEALKRKQDLGSEIESRPFISVVAAFGVGLLLGKIFGR